MNLVWVYFQIWKLVVVSLLSPISPMDSASTSAAALKLEIARLSGKFTQDELRKPGLMKPD